MKTTILVATDSKELFEQVKSALLAETTELSWVKSGQSAMEIIKGDTPDLVVADLQIGNMGGGAISYELYLETSSGRVPKIPLILLLDRTADVFLANEVGASAYVIKPIDVLELKQIFADLFAAVPITGASSQSMGD